MAAAAPAPRAGRLRRLRRPAVRLAHTRLSIIDLPGGAQPLGNEDGRVLTVYNGEVYNYIELRQELERHGHRFRTRSDTEVLVHAYEQWGDAMLHRLNGQFAFAIYDRRDRIGLPRARPLRRAPAVLRAARWRPVLRLGGEGALRQWRVEAAPDPHGLDEVFTFWAARAPRTPFRGVPRFRRDASALARRATCRSAATTSCRYAEATEEPADALDTARCT